MDTENRSITISLAEYIDLRLAAEKLIRLESAGVDCWGLYYEALNPTDQASLLEREDEITAEVLARLTPPGSTGGGDG